jgi:Raf kinase inhibitor-like YbhB/YbcL family protein
MKLFSKVFENGGNIPARYNFDLGDTTLPLMWAGLPKGTKSLVLVCDDPDAEVGTWGHWVLFNIPASTRELPATAMELPDEVRVGKNQLTRHEYAGTNEKDGMNRYFFSLYALDCELDLKDGTCKKEIFETMGGHVLEEASLMGFYTKPARSSKKTSI